MVVCFVVKVLRSKCIGSIGILLEGTGLLVEAPVAVGFQRICCIILVVVGVPSVESEIRSSVNT